MTEPTPKRVTSLHELAQDIAPARDLWPQIEAQLARDSRPSVVARQAGGVRRAVPRQLRWLAAAAAVGCLAIGVWIGRSALPGGTQPPLAAVTPPAEGAMQTAWVTDPRYRRNHDALVSSLGTQLASLPPASRDKVMKSLTTIGTAKRELEEALGKDPSNALLQELLVNTYQDEMRVLTDVHEAGNAGKGI